MTDEQLLENSRYLAEKYLSKERCDEIMQELTSSMQQGKHSTGKNFLHVLSSEKLNPLDRQDRDLLKDIAHEFGV